MTDGEILINSPQVDWVTVTTYEPEVWRRIVKDCLGEVELSPHAQNRQGYAGFSQGAFWYGQGTQDGKPHYMAVASGATAHPLHRELLPQMTCTRIDLQITIDLPDWYKNRSLVETLRMGSWPGRRRTIPMREDGKGGSTVYIGSMASDKLIRIYIKGLHYLRYEIQYRRGYAQDCAKSVLNGGEKAIAAILGTELTKLPQHPILERFAQHCAGYQNVAAYKANPDMIARMKWLATLLDTFQKMANDHDYGHTVVEWFQQIIDSTRGGDP